ncbi:MAG: hypothetical protein ABFS16_02580 [Bacteroidota bacterium]
MINLTEYPYFEIIGSLCIFIIGIYFAWDSYKNQKRFKLILAILAVLYGGYTSYISIKSSINNKKRDNQVENTLQEHKTKIDEILTLDEITKIGNKAFSGDRNSFLKLKKITASFGEKRDAAIVELDKIYRRYSTRLYLNGVKIEKYDKNKELIEENDISTETLISILLLDSQYLFRARSAQLLKTRNEKFVHEALLLSIFTDDNLVVMQNSILAFENLTGYKNRVLLEPYGNLGFWYDNMDNIQKSVSKINKVSILPLDKYMTRILTKVRQNEKEEMLYWYSTGYEMCELINEKKKIEPNNWR